MRSSGLLPPPHYCWRESDLPIIKAVVPAIFYERRQPKSCAQFQKYKLRCRCARGTLSSGVHDRSCMIVDRSVNAHTGDACTASCAGRKCAAVCCQPRCDAARLFALERCRVPRMQITCFDSCLLVAVAQCLAGGPCQLLQPLHVMCGVLCEHASDDGWRVDGKRLVRSVHCAR